MKLTDFFLPEILEAEQKAREASEAAEATVKAAQARCLHPHVAEAPYYSGTLSTLPPFRVCLRCGYAEEGWGIGYRRLATGPDDLVFQITREQGYAIRRGTTHTPSSADPMRETDGS